MKSFALKLLFVFSSAILGFSNVAFAVGDLTGMYDAGTLTRRSDRRRMVTVFSSPDREKIVDQAAATTNEQISE